MWDLLIVGTGPAGVSAALTARARGLSFLWFGSRRLSDNRKQSFVAGKCKAGRSGSQNREIQSNQNPH